VVLAEYFHVNEADSTVMRAQNKIRDNGLVMI
jgi:hypothetical protein